MSQVALVDVDRAVGVADAQLLVGDEERLRPIRVSSGKAGILGGVAAAGGTLRFTLRDEGRRAFFQIAHVDVEPAVFVSRDESLFGREEDLRAAGARLLEVGGVGVVAARRSERDLAGDAGFDPRVGVVETLVDVRLVVGITGDQLLDGFEEDHFAVGRNAFVVGGRPEGASCAKQRGDKRYKRECRDARSSGAAAGSWCRLSRHRCSIG